MSWILPVLLLSSAVAAQDPRGQQPRMPDSFTPPSGLCRLWISGVPASQQPAPTDCASAIRNRPSNAAVVFGPQRRGESMEMRPFSGRAGQPRVRQPEVRPVQTREEVRVRPPDRPPERDPEPAVKAVKRKPEKPQ